MIGGLINWINENITLFLKTLLFKRWLKKQKRQEKRNTKVRLLSMKEAGFSCGNVGHESSEPQHEGVYISIPSLGEEPKWMRYDGCLYCPYLSKCEFITLPPDLRGESCQYFAFENKRIEESRIGTSCITGGLEK